ncbi:MAG: phosphodiester glycosidase family protein [Candidatus Bruticola sp.]
MKHHYFLCCLTTTALGLTLWTSAPSWEAQAAVPDQSSATVLTTATDKLADLPVNSDEGRFNRLESIRHSAFQQKLRLVFNTEEEPVFQYWLEKQGQCLVIELINTRQNTVKPDSAPKSKAVQNWQISWPNFNRCRFTINFAAAVQGSSISFFKLKEPHRLVADIDTSPKALPDSYKISPGITWSRQFIKDPTFGTLLWNQLLFDRSDPNISIDVALAKNDPNKTAVLSDIVSQEEGAIAGINGGFFNMPSGGLLGLVVKDGKLISPHVGRRPARSVIAIPQQGEPFIDRLKAVNGQVVRLNGQSVPPLRMALGAGPTLLKNGQVCITADAEALGPKGNDITRACGRSVIAFNKDKMMLACLSGARDSHSQGWKLPVLAKYMQKKGMTEALNLDGGGSTGMAIGGNIVGNGPQAGTYQRPIGNALIIKDSRGTSYPTLIKVELPEQLPSDGRSQSRASILALNSKGNPVPDGTKIELYGRGISCPPTVITKDGRAEFDVQALRSPGMGGLTACGLFSRGTANMRLVSGAPCKIIARLVHYQPQSIARQTILPDSTTEYRYTDLDKVEDKNSTTSTETDWSEVPQPQEPLKGLIQTEDQETQKTSVEPSLTPPARPSVIETNLKNKQKLTLDVIVEDEHSCALPGSLITVEDSQGRQLFQGQTNRSGSLCLNLETEADNSRLFIKSPKLKTLTLELSGRPTFSK